MLSQIIRDFIHVYMVVDSLDECWDKEDIMYVIQELNDCGQPNLHVLLASRPETIIESSVSGFLTHQILLNQRNVDVDISTYIEAVLQNDQKLAQWPLYIRQQIQAKLENGSCGMYVGFLRET
jgi:hypothetical protein